MRPNQYKQKSAKIDWPLFTATSGFIVIFCTLAAINMQLLSSIVDKGFDLAHRFFGLFWQWELLINFIVSLIICCLPGSRATLGNVNKPEFSFPQWTAMIMCTLLAGGGVFWAACEPLAHFVSPPPLFNLSGDNSQVVSAALAQSYLHWGFLGWAIFGSTSTIVFMYYHYEKGLPLAPRLLLYPLLGKRAIHGLWGIIADAACIISAVAGTVGVIGFIGLQVSYGLNLLLNIPNNFLTHATIVTVIVSLYTLSAVSGLKRGVKILSEINILMVIFLLIFMLIAGPTTFIFKHFLTGQSVYYKYFFQWLYSETIVAFLDHKFG